MASLSCFIFFCFINVLFFLPGTIIAADYLRVAYYNCLHNATTATNNSLSSTFTNNLRLALTDLTNLSSSATRYNITTIGSGIDQVYAMIQCRGDQSSQSCFDCVSTATSTLQKDCPSSIGARIQLDGCYLRYDNKPFFTPNFTFVIGSCFGKTSDAVFLTTVQSLMQNVTTLAPSNGGYAAESAGDVHALAQCLGYLNESECSQCLTSSNYRLLCDSTLGEQWHSASCYYRYETYSFFDTPTPPPPAGGGSTPSPPSSGAVPALPTIPPTSTTQKTSGSKIGIIIPVSVVGAVLIATVAVCLVTLVWRHKAKAKQADPHAAQRDAWSRPRTEVFSLHELEVATRNFHPDNKLGEGGFGTVYKGTLPNGQHVAVKKLALRSQQGRREFMNEVNLITSVQHRNLIKLLGSCVEGPERMLVYEYLPNKSVDTLLFDSVDGITLDWPTRCGIILGMARGLAYLHEESQIRIIHRDIKPSNILLDDHLNPVIADFGLARLVSDEETHINTRVAGTLGYLAPEYAFHGQLTEKVDVFSFGVVTLELISGRRNSNERILEWAWRLYQQDRQLEVVDPKLGNGFSIGEVIRVVHVALLCTQESAEQRPTMSTVTLHLSGRSDILEIPTKPPFVGLSDFKAPVDSTNHVWTLTSHDSSSNPLIHTSNNQLSVSEVEPR